MGHDSNPDDWSVELEHLLVEFDESLAAHAPQAGADDLEQLVDGSGEEGASSLTEELSAEQRDRLNRLRNCLRMINRVRDAESHHDHSLSDTVGEPGDTPGAAARFERLIENFEATAEDDDNEARTIGRFQVMKELGRGGHGIVFLAIDPHLEREVALKVARPEVVMTPALRERFLREGKAVAGLNHANLLPVYEAGNVGPIYYLASAYCRGMSLAQWLREDTKTPVSPPSAARLVMTLADAVQHAHLRGVVHRDLKPGNVLLEPRGEDESPKVDDFTPLITDFGLAKSEAGPTDATRDGTILGTPAYMAPEQATGRTEDVGPAADLYALGGILYELLAGRPPFRKESDLATLRAVELEEPAAPSKVNGDVPRDLEAICLKCLEKKPEQRYDSASHLAADLARFLSGEPVRARRIGNTERLRRWCRRNPVVASLIALVVISVTVGFAAVTWQWREARANLIEVRRQRERAEAHFRWADEAVDQLLTEVGHELTNVPQADQVRRRLLEKALSLHQSFVQNQSEDPALRYDLARANRRMSDIYRMLGDYPRAQDLAERSIALLGQLSIDEEPGIVAELIEARRILADSLQQTGDFADAEAVHQASMDALERWIEDGSENHELRMLAIECYNDFGSFLERAGRRDEAEIAYRSALALALMQSDDVGYRQKQANSYNNLAIVLKNTGQLEEAEVACTNAVHILEALLDELPENRQLRRELADSTVNLANIWRTNGEHERTIPSYVDAVGLYQELVEEFPFTPRYRFGLANAWFSLGYAHRRVGDDEASEQAYRECVQIFQELVDENPEVPFYRSVMASALNNLANLFNDTGRKDEAEEAYLSAAGVHRDIASRFPERVGYQSRLGLSLGNVGRFVQNQGKLERAEELLREAVERQGKAYQANPTHPDYGRYLRTDFASLIRSVVMQGRYAEAASLIEEMAALDPHGMENTFACATVAAYTLDRIRSDKALGHDDRRTLETIFADHAVELLRQSVEAGLDDPEAVKADSFDGLLDREDYQQLRNAVEPLSEV